MILLVRDPFVLVVHSEDADEIDIKAAMSRFTFVEDHLSSEKVARTLTQRTCMFDACLNLEPFRAIHVLGSSVYAPSTEGFPLLPNTLCGLAGLQLGSGGARHRPEQGCPTGGEGVYQTSRIQASSCRF